MVPVKKAAALLGIDKGELRAKLSCGHLQGERKVVGEKEKWFIYTSELDVLLDNMPGLVEEKERTTLEGLQKFFEAQTAPGTVQDIQIEEPLQVEGVVEASSETGEDMGLELNAVVEALTIEFAYRLTEEHQAVLRWRDQVHERDLIIQRLAPMEKALQLEVKQSCLRELELKNLRTVVASLENEVARLRLPWWKRIERRLFGQRKSLPARIGD
jgi:hypothetical protein